MGKITQNTKRSKLRITMDAQVLAYRAAEAARQLAEEGRLAAEAARAQAEARAAALEAELARLRAECDPEWSQEQNSRRAGDKAL
jgi:hypothetical protein